MTKAGAGALAAGPYHRRMLSLRASLVIAALLLGQSGCAPYDPPIQGDHTAEAYKTDLEKCRTSSTETVRLKNASTPQSWVISPITGPPAVRALIRKCMQDKGYVVQQTE